MISYEDCAAICGLGFAEIEAIAEHEHVPEVTAAALGNYLLQKAGGAAVIRCMLVDDIRTALSEGRLEHATQLLMTLRHFMNDHPPALSSFD